jgi:hypothetical protein
MIDDFDIEPETEHAIPIWRVGISIFFLIIVLVLSSFLVCFTNEQCRSNIPTLNNLLDSTFVVPFMVTAMNSLLSLHLVVSIGIHRLTMGKAYIGSRVQMVSSILVYVSVVITLFVFPFTSWERIWANITILVTFSFWMSTVIWCLYKYYKYKINLKRKLVTFQLVLMIVYNVSGIGYIIFRFLPNLIAYLLAIEIVCGLAMLTFLGVSIVHLCEIKIKILTK